jgi:cupin fold WbuC family metalloprotein
MTLNWLKSGNDSYYAYAEDSMVDQSIIDQLREQGRWSNTGRARICLHKRSSDSPNVMLIYHDHRTLVPIHKHSPFGEYLIICKGAFNLTVFDSKIDSIKTVELSSEPNGIATHWIGPDIWHQMSFTEPCLFYEISEGPFHVKTTHVADTSQF